MCGPSSSEESIQGNTQDFSNLLQEHYGTLFAQQQGVFANINKALSPIVAAGPSQNGFSGAQLSNLQTKAINDAGAANTAAQQAARTFGAGQGGGATSGITSGITKQIQGAIAGQEAGQEASTLSNINLANEQQGNTNYWRAQGGMQALGNAYNPGAAAGESTASSGQAFQEASTINQQNNALGEDIAGFATALAGSAGDIYKAYK